jgi:hypothetical protein
MRDEACLQAVACDERAHPTPTRAEVAGAERERPAVEQLASARAAPFVAPSARRRCRPGDTDWPRIVPIVA